MNKSRRKFLGTGVAAAAAVTQAPLGHSTAPPETFIDIIRPPDSVAAYVEGSGRTVLAPSGGRWQAAGVELTADVKDHGGKRTLAIAVSSPGSALERLQVRWLGRFPEGSRFLGDHWERSYGDLEWGGFDGERVMPWYFLAATGRGTHGYGVMTGSAAFCFWEVDAQGISLWLDVRNGGSGVQLGERRLNAAEVVALHGHTDGSPYTAASALCRALSEQPRLPRQAGLRLQ